MIDDLLKADAGLTYYYAHTKETREESLEYRRQPLLVFEVITNCRLESCTIHFLCLKRLFKFSLLAFLGLFGLKWPFRPYMTLAYSPRALIYYFLCKLALFHGFHKLIPR